MGRGLNQVTLMGGLTRDPELKHTPSGMAVLRFTLGIGYSKKVGDGKYEDAADFPTCIAFGKTAETIAKYVGKGSQIMVLGKIQTGKYEPKDGSGTKYTTDVLVNEIRFVGSKKSTENTAHGQAKANGFASQDFPVDFSELDSDNEVEIPF